MSVIHHTTDFSQTSQLLLFQCNVHVEMNKFLCSLACFWMTIIDGQFYNNEPVHEISNKMACATSKASDQPAHTRSLIRAFASRLSIL